MEPVNQEVCGERRHTIDERFARDKERLDELESQMSEIAKLSVQIGEMLKRDDERLERHDESLREQGRRIGALEKYSLEKLVGRIERLESKAGKRWEKIVECAISGIVGALVAAGMALVLL